MGSSRSEGLHESLRRSRNLLKKQGKVLQSGNVNTAISSKGRREQSEMTDGGYLPIGALK